MIKKKKYRGNIGKIFDFYCYCRRLVKKSNDNRGNVAGRGWEGRVF